MVGRAILMMVLLTGLALAQKPHIERDTQGTLPGTRINLSTYTGAVNFGSATYTIPNKTGTTLPSTCTVGEVFFKTDAGNGQNLYVCSTTNMWYQIVGGSQTFLGLSDTPSSYVGYGGYALRVNSTENAIEFVRFPVLSVFGRTGNVVAQAGDYTASQVTFSPVGNISSTDVQMAIAELDTKKVPTTRQIICGTGLSGCGDLSANRTLSVVTDSTTQRVEVANSGALVGTRKRINFIPGSGITITTSDDATNNRVNVTIAASGGVGGGASNFADLDDIFKPTLISSTQLYVTAGKWQWADSVLFAGPCTLTLSGTTTGTIWVWLDSSSIVFGHNLGDVNVSVTGTGCVEDATATGIPQDVIPLFTVTVPVTTGTLGAITDYRSPYQHQKLVAGSHITLIRSGGSVIIAGDGNATSLWGRPVGGTAPTNGQVLTWNSAANQWEPQTPSGGGGGGGIVPWDTGYAYWIEDFWPSGSGTQLSWLALNENATCTKQAVASEADHPAIYEIKITAGTVANGQCSNYSRYSVGNLWNENSGDAWEIQGIIKTDAVLNADFGPAFGFGLGLNGTALLLAVLGGPQIQTCHIGTWNSNNIMFVAHTTAGYHCVDSGVALAANTWYKIIIRSVDASTFQYSINGSAFTSYSVSPSTLKPSGFLTYGVRTNLTDGSSSYTAKFDRIAVVFTVTR